MCFQNFTSVTILDLYCNSHILMTSVPLFTEAHFTPSSFFPSSARPLSCLLLLSSWDSHGGLSHVFQGKPSTIFCLNESLHYVPLSLFSAIHNIVLSWIETSFFFPLFAVNIKRNLQYRDFHYTLATLLFWFNFITLLLARIISHFSHCIEPLSFPFFTVPGCPFNILTNSITEYRWSFTKVVSYSTSLLGLSAEVLLNIFFEEAKVWCDSIYLEDAVGVLIKPCRWFV